MRPVLLLAWLPAALATLGAGVDEWRALGFTIWRSACRASGLSLPSIATFTIELLPTAVIGALVGGVLLLGIGFHGRGRRARGALASHAACVATMPLGLLLCATALPWGLTLAAESALAVLVAAALWWLMRIRKATYAQRVARGVSRIPLTSAAIDNFPRPQTPESP